MVEVSGRLRLRSCLLGTEACEGAGEGVEAEGAATVRLFDSLEEDEVRLLLNALI